MTNHVARLYALATSLVVFFAVWLAVSAHPWAQSREGRDTGRRPAARARCRRASATCGRRRAGST